MKLSNFLSAGLSTRSGERVRDAVQSVSNRDRGRVRVSVRVMSQGQSERGRTDSASLRRCCPPRSPSGRRALPRACARDRGTVHLIDNQGTTPRSCRAQSGRAHACPAKMIATVID